MLLPTSSNLQQQPQQQQTTAKPTQTANKTPQMKALDALNQLGRNLMEKSLNNPTAPLNAALQQANSFEMPLAPQKNLSLNELQQKKATTPVTSAPTPNSNSINEDHASQVFNSLNNLFVALESIKPSSVQPFGLYDKNSVKIVLFFGRDQPAADVNVIVASVTSLRTNSALKNFSLQAAVPKVRFKIKSDANFNILNFKISFLLLSSSQ